MNWLAFMQHPLGRARGLVRRDRPGAGRRARGRGRDGRHRPAAGIGQHHLAHAVRRPGDDRDHGDLLPGDRAAAAVRQPAAEVDAMTIDWWTLGIQTVNVVVLVWLLQHFFWRPVAAMIEQRRADRPADRGRRGGEPCPGTRRPPRPRSRGPAPVSMRNARRSWPTRMPRRSRRRTGLRSGARPPRRPPPARHCKDRSDREGGGRRPRRPGPNGPGSSRSTSPGAWRPDLDGTAGAGQRSWMWLVAAIQAMPAQARQAVAAADGGIAGGGQRDGARYRRSRSARARVDRQGVRGSSPASPSSHRPGAHRRPGAARRPFCKVGNSWRADLGTILAGPHACAPWQH